MEAMAPFQHSCPQGFAFTGTTLPVQDILAEFAIHLLLLKWVLAESHSRRIQSEYATMRETLLSEESSVGTFFGNRV